MNLFLQSPIVQEMIDTLANLYRLGWDERNGGNVSYRLDETDLLEIEDVKQPLRKIPLHFNAEALIGEYFLVTGTGKYFKNIKKEPEDMLGLMRVDETGKEADLLWGFTDGGLPTSELPAHLMSHVSRLKEDDNHRVVMHNHATHLLAMTHSHSLDEKDFTKTLWQMCTECLVVFPDGVGVLPWLVPGTTEIGEATANKMSDYRLVIWPFHGVYGTGQSLDDAFGLIETAEKAAEVYTHVMSQGGIRQTLTDSDLKRLAHSFGVQPKEGYLK